MNARDILISLSLSYKGKWEKIYNAISKKEDVINCNYGGQCITILDANYPDKLKQIYNPPFVLYYEGDLSLLNENNIISIVCSKEPTSQGLYGINKLVNGLDIATTGLDMDIIDAVKRPIVVLPYGLNHNRDLVREVVASNGLVLTEYPLDEEPTAETMAIRYRIIEAIANKTLVIEGKKNGSANIRVAYSLQYGHDVFVMPLSVDKSDDYVNNKLISEGAICCTDREQLCA